MSAWPRTSCTSFNGGVGFTGHADLAAAEGADTVLVVNPLVPTFSASTMPIRMRGVYSIMEQTGRICSQNLLSLGMETLALRYPTTRFFVLQPPRDCDFLFGPCMSFDASRKALRFGYSFTRGWLASDGATLVDRLNARYPAAV